MRNNFTDEERVSRILNLPLKTIDAMKACYAMPVSEPEFSQWFVTHSDLVLKVMKENFEDLLFPGKLRPEFSEAPA